MKNDIIKEINKKENMLKKYISYHQYNMKEGEMWYAYFKESVPLQVSALSKEALIRELWKLNEMEYFKYTKCVIFGRNGEEKSYIYESMEDCLKDSVLNKLNIPIIYDADISMAKLICSQAACLIDTIWNIFKDNYIEVRRNKFRKGSN